MITAWKYQSGVLIATVTTQMPTTTRQSEDDLSPIMKAKTMTPSTVIEARIISTRSPDTDMIPTTNVIAITRTPRTARIAMAKIVIVVEVREENDCDCVPLRELTFGIDIFFW